MNDKQTYELNRNQQLWADEQQRRINTNKNDNAKPQVTREQHTILNRFIRGGHISALFLLVVMLVTPMLLKWENVWGNRNAENRNDIYSFYYNDEYTIALPDGTTKVIKWYNPNLTQSLDGTTVVCNENNNNVCESPYMNEVINYEELRDVYTYNEDANDTIQSVEDVIKGLNRVMFVGRKVYDGIARAVDFVEDEVDWEIFDTPIGYLRNFWNWIKRPFNNSGGNE